jgi:hypothetical protein
MHDRPARPFVWQRTFDALLSAWEEAQAPASWFVLQSFTSTRMHNLGFTFHTETTAQFPSGSNRNCYVNPFDHSRAVLMRYPPRRRTPGRDRLRIRDTKCLSVCRHNFDLHLRRR